MLLLLLLLLLGMLLLSALCAVLQLRWLLLCLLHALLALCNKGVGFLLLLIWSVNIIHVLI
jgi:hypothetical protein